MKKTRDGKSGRVRLTLQAKLTVIILIAVLIPLAVTFLFLAGRLRRMVTSDTIRSEQAQTAEAAPELNRILNEIVSVSKKVRSGELRLPEAVTGPVTAARQYIDLPEDDPFFADPANEGFAPASRIKGTYWRGILSQTGRATLFCPPRYLGMRERREFADCAYVAATRVILPEQGSVLSYLVLYFPSQTFQDVLRENLTESGSVSYIANERDETITSTDSTLSGIFYMDHNTIRTSLMASNGFLERNVLGETVYVSYYFLSPADWHLVTVTPDAPLANRSARIMLSLIALYLLATSAAVLISILLARSISRRLGAVSRQMSAVQTGPPVPIRARQADDEIGDLVDSYNYMADKINELMDEQRSAAEELRAAEFRTLQAQINPHFLYNTMEMINQQARAGQTEKTNDAITALSRFYRLTLSRQGTMTSIARELEHVSIYVKIQNMRFDEGIDFVVDIPDELLEFRIPRLTLQPIVENAILHGILEKPERTGTIVLTGWQEGGDIVLLVSDDGVGMSAGRLDKLLSGEPAGGRGTQIAVINTHRRLQVVFGEEYGLAYKSTPGKGTEVTIRIPAVRDENAGAI